MLIFQMLVDQAGEALDRWVSWARRCRIPVFVNLQKIIIRHTPSILAAIEHGLSNGPTESVNTKDPAHHPYRVRIQIPTP